jgi:hypothetical protein
VSTTRRRGGSYTRNGRTFTRRGGTVHYAGRTRTGGHYAVSGYGPTSALFGARAARWIGKRALRGVARWWDWVTTPDGHR